MDLIDLECPTRYKCMPYLINGFDAIADAIATSEYTAKKRREVSKIRDKFLEIRTVRILLSIDCLFLIYFYEIWLRNILFVFFYFLDLRE